MVGESQVLLIKDEASTQQALSSAILSLTKRTAIVVSVPTVKKAALSVHSEDTMSKITPRVDNAKVELP